MRKPLPTDQRKRTLFSCNHCKTRKIACKRVQDQTKSDDISVACVECTKKRIQCTTSIKRRRKVPQAHVGIHYKCILALVEAMYPDQDVHSIEGVVEIGRKMGVKMPDIQNESFVDSQHLGSTISSQMVGPQAKLAVKQEAMIEDDKFILDIHGTSHFIGPNSGVAFLSFTSSYMAKSKAVTHDFGEIYQRTYENEISSTNERPLQLQGLNLETFPYVYDLKKEVCDRFADIFFTSLCKYFPCISQRRFQSIYLRLWNNGSMVKSDLSISEICLVYMVVILGYSYNIRDDDSIEIPLVTTLLNNVNFALAEFIISPDKDSIVILYLLSLHLNKNRKRECGYLMIAAACRSAISMGLHRQSIIDCEPDVDRQIELQSLWWCLYQQEVRSCISLGRMSSINAMEISIKEPLEPFTETCTSITEHTSIDNGMGLDPTYQYFTLSSKLSRILHDFEGCNKNGFSIFLQPNETKKTIEKLLNRFTQWYESGEEFFTDMDPELTTFQYKLKLEYWYYKSIYLFQFLMKCCEGNTNEFGREMALECIGCALNIEKLLTESDNYITINSLWSLHIWFAYQATLCLCCGYTWLENSEDLEEAMKGLRSYNLRNMDNCVGSVTRINVYIEVLLGSFEFMKVEKRTDAFDFYEFNIFDI